MNNIAMSLDFMRFKNAGITMLTSSKTGKAKKCVIIPIEDNDLLINEHGVSINLIGFPYDGKEMQTHLIKQSFTKEKRDAMTEEEKGHFQFWVVCGNLKSTLPRFRTLIPLRNNLVRMGLYKAL